MLINNKTKKRYWTFVLYEDSAPSYWRDYLSNLYIPYTISPYHCFDKTETGEPKKPHYHIVLYFDGPTTYKNVMSLISDLGVNTTQFVQSPRGMYRYLCHLDNPDKYQYDPKDIVEGGGFNYEEIIGYTSTETLHLLSRLYAYIRENKITEYSVLVDKLEEQNLLDLFEITQLKTLNVNCYLHSYRNYHKELEQKKTEII